MSNSTDNHEIKSSENSNLELEHKKIAKAEMRQGVLALYIPLVAFLACVIMAGGVYLIVNGVFWGYVMFTLAIILIISTIVAFLNFQNKLREAGGILDKEDI